MINHIHLEAFLKYLLISALTMLITSTVGAMTAPIYDAQRKGIQLTEKDKEVLEIGEISTGRYVAGGILGTYPIGFGIGHAIQGRWSEQGWIFTAGELGSVAMLLGGLSSCLKGDADDFFDDCSGGENALITVGLIGFIGFRIWEIVDVWAVPPSHNKKHRELQEYINKAPEKTTKASLTLSPLSAKLGQGAALVLNF